MSMTLISQALSHETLKGVVTQDEQGQLVVQDSNAAMRIMFTSDANSTVYKIVQLALQLQTLREQAMAKENQEYLQQLAAAGKVKILQLEEALQESEGKIKNLETELKDIHTKEELHQYELALNKEARISGVGDIAAGILLLPFLVTTLPGAVMLGRGIITLAEKPDELRMMEDKIELYRAFYPEASLTDAYEYVKENPARFSKQDSEKVISIETYKKEKPEANFENFEEYVVDKIHFKELLEARLKPRSARAPHF